MKNFRDLPWPRVLAESAIIVASILLALGVDAWWSNRQERLDELVVLNALKTELDRFIQFRDLELRQVVAVQESAQKLLDLGRSPTDSVSDFQVDGLLSDTTWYTWTNNRITPVAESVISSGRLGLISNRELREMIPFWLGYSTGFATVARRDLEFLDQQYLPYLRKHASIAQIYAADDGQPGNESQAAPLSVAMDEFVGTSHKNLILQSEFQNLLIDRISILYDFQGWYQVVDGVPTVEEGLELLKSEIEKHHD